MALNKAPAKSSLAMEALKGLSEHYYNKKQYKLAVRYYNKLLKHDVGQWKTKHLFNLAWCNFKINKQALALSAMMKVFALSGMPEAGKNKKTIYVNYRDQALESLPLFFSHANQVEAGVKFILKEFKHPQQGLVKMAGYLKDFGKYGPALYVYNKAVSQARARNDRDGLINAMALKLNFFEEFKKHKKFWHMTKSFSREHHKRPLPKKLHQEIVLKIKNHISKLQNIFHRSRGIDKKELRIILSYFREMRILDPINTNHYRFFQGETLFGVKEYKMALKFYMKSLEFFKNKKIKLKKIKNWSKKLLIHYLPR